MQLKSNVKLILLTLLLAGVVLACGLGGDGPPRNAEVISVVANTSLTPWLEGAVDAFNAEKVETSANKPVYVELEPLEAGQAVIDLAAGKQAALWIPDTEVWASVLAERGEPGFQGQCASVATSPLVIGMWRPVAEALGWPGRSLGWLDVGSLAADPSAWDYYSGGQFGPTLRLGHTHPGLSGSGTSTLLAIVQAAEATPSAVGVADIQQPIVQASVAAFEGAVAWFSPSTDNLAQTMRDRGAGYLGAAVMYESTVVRYGGPRVDLVPIYPFEGTFMATHPACLNASAGPPQQEAAGLFRDYLLSLDGQALALANGLRPVNPDIELGPPLEPGRGVDLNQPETVFSPPTVETVYAVQDLWQAARKDVNMVMLIDVSGSMRGRKIENTKAAAEQFVAQMGEEDVFTLIVFEDQPWVLLEAQPVGAARQEAIEIIRSLQDGGSTALYDAIGQGAEVIARTTSSRTSNAMVVLTDGEDTGSEVYRFDDRLIEAATANDTTIFTIAYGNDADERILADLADRANGNFYLGNEANIAAIYEEMSAAFGGSAGIGR